MPSQQGRHKWEQIPSAQDAASEKQQQMGALVGATAEVRQEQGRLRWYELYDTAILYVSYG